MNTKILPLRIEAGNTWTHLAGALFALTCIWSVWPASELGWEWTMGLIFFLCGMFLMFTSSTVYHWVHPGRIKTALRKLDHISIYVMIACSYTPICVGVIGGWLGWTVFAVLWVLVLAGTVYKLLAMGRWPKLSLALYIAMGWSVVFVIKPVIDQLSWPALICLVAEGLLYTGGTYFFANDHKRHYHAVWHVFVLLGALAHWVTLLLIIYGI